MLTTSRHAGRLATGQTELLHTIRRCGLTSNLKLCLDAGDANSYSGSGQSWLDTSGNGYDFFRGADGSAAADDPTFNGTAGRRSSTEYWSFDGGDFFRYHTANEIWMNNLHKAGAKFTVAGWVYVGANPAVASSQFGTSNASDVTGVVLQWIAGRTLQALVRNAGALVQIQTTTAALTLSAWNFLAWSMDEAVGAGGSLLMVNSTAETASSTYSSPATGAGQTMEIGARGGAGYPMQNTDRLGMFAAWEGVALTQVQLNALYQCTRGRFGV